MKKKFKEQLRAAFDAPAPVRKVEFLQSLNFPKTSRIDFIFGQIGYIRKRVWIISCLFVIAALVGLRFTANNNLSLIWIISSILPFVSLVAITEITRSASYNMAELEMSCRYNFADVVLTRLGILSGFNLSIFGVIILLLNREASFGIFRTGIYMLAPFMLTCSISLFMLNRLRSRETTYICGGIAGFIGIANILFTTQYEMFFSDKYMSFWIFAFIILAVFTVMESIKLIKKTEELQWNLL